MALWPASVTYWPPEQEAREGEERQGLYGHGLLALTSALALPVSAPSPISGRPARKPPPAWTQVCRLFPPARQAADTPAPVGLEGSSGPSPLLAHPALPSNLTTCLGIFIAAHGGTEAG